MRPSPLRWRSYRRYRDYARGRQAQGVATFATRGRGCQHSDVAGDRPRVRSPRTRQKSGALSSPSSPRLDFHKRFAMRWTSQEARHEFGLPHEVRQAEMVPADLSGDTSTWESGSAGHSDGRPPRTPTCSSVLCISQRARPVPSGISSPIN